MEGLPFDILQTIWDWQSVLTPTGALPLSGLFNILVTSGRRGVGVLRQQMDDLAIGPNGFTVKQPVKNPWIHDDKEFCGGRRREELDKGCNGANQLLLRARLTV